MSDNFASNSVVSIGPISSVGTETAEASTLWLKDKLVSHEYLEKVLGNASEVVSLYGQSSNT